MKLRVVYILFAVALLAGCKGSLPENETVLVSPIADTLYYSSTEKGPFQVFAKKNDSFVQVINDVAYDYWWVQISPDKQHFLCYKSGIDNFFRENDYTNAELWMFKIDGTGGKKLIDKGQFSWRAQGYATWHPDGKHIVMAAEVKDPNDDANYRWHLFLTDTSSTTPIKLSNRVGLFASPVVNPGGNKLAYTAFPDGTESGSVFKQELFVADLDVTNGILTNETQLTDDTWWDQQPAWSPDGNSLVFSTAINPTNLFENINLRKYKVATQTVEVLRADGGSYTVPCWAGNGSYLYVQYRANGQRPFSLARIEADGSGFTEVLRNEAADIINPIVF